MIHRPSESEYAPFYASYVSAVPEGDVRDLLASQQAEVRRMLATVPLARETHRYAPDKWSIRQVVGHMTDAERVFGYRAFCISRGEDQPLPSFDENLYVAASGSENQSLGSLAEAFERARAASQDVFAALDEAAWTRTGTASGHPVSVRALACIMVGHAAHHLAILRERYGVAG